VLLDLGPHLVDLVCWLTRTSIARVRGEVSEQRARVELELAGGRGRGRIACASNRPYVETLEITAGGTRIARRREGGLVRNALAIVRAAPSPLVASLASQLEAFGAAVRGAAPPELARAADGVAALAAVDAAYASAEAGSAWMDVPKAATVRECSPSSSSTP
jgi:predicted dehydrogenase